MKKPTLIILLLSVFCFNTFSQFSFKWAPPGTTPDYASTQKTIPYTNKEGSIFLMREFTAANIEGNETWIEEYSISKGLVNTTKLDLATGDISDNTQLETYIVSGDHLILICRQWQKDKTVSYYAITFSFNDGYQDNKTKLCSFTAKNVFTQGNQAFAASPDGTKFAVLVDAKFEKKEFDKFKLLLFDTKTFNKVSEQEIEVPIQAKRSTNQLIVDNDGSCYLHRNYALPKAKADSYIISVNGTSGKVSQSRVEIPGKATALYQSKLLFINKKVYLGGFYTVDYRNITGTLVSKIDKNTGVIIETKLHPFGREIMKLVGIDKLKIIDVLLLSDGRIEVIGEIQYSKKVGSAQSLETQKYENVRDDIIVTCIKLDLSLDWENYISKRQTYTTIGNTKAPWSSFSYGLFNDKLYTIYNTHTTPSRWKTPEGIVQKREDFINAYRYPFMYVMEDNSNIVYGDQHYGLPLFNCFENSFSYNLGIYHPMSIATKNKLYFLSKPNDKKELLLGRMDIAK